MTNKILKSKTIEAEFLPSGDLFELRLGDLMLNQLNGNLLDGSINQIYLRHFKEEGIVYKPLLGLKSSSIFSTGKNEVSWEGEVEGISYVVRFILSSDDIWFWQVTLKGQGEEVDLVIGQDQGLAIKGTVQTNEAYISQYIDHHVDESASGYIISSRQNQEQSGRFPYMQLGGLSTMVGYSTDGYQFFGRTYKETEEPMVLSQASLPNEVYQFEMSYVGLQSEKIVLSETEASVIFYGIAQESHAEAVTEPSYSQEAIKKIWEDATAKNEVLDVSSKIESKIGQTKAGYSYDEKELTELYGQLLDKEYDGTQLLSFFTKDHHHVVLKEKESQNERAHGGILFSGSDVKATKPVLATTGYMYGIFNSQIVLGNTTNNKLLSNSRNSLNLMKKTGQRIYIKQQDEWQMLGMASAFEMGFNMMRWYYKFADDVLVIENYTTVDDYEIKLKFRSMQNKEYDVAIANQVVMGEIEDRDGYQLTQDGNLLSFKGKEQGTISTHCHELVYYIHSAEKFERADERLFTATDDVGVSPLVVLTYPQVSEVNLTIQGSLVGAPYKQTIKDIVTEGQKFDRLIDGLTRNFKLSHDKPEINEEAASFNTLLYWYTQNMLVHYLTPHGLEQYGGAAWGTRDVSQGPVEYFMAFGHFDIVKGIIIKIYENQYNGDGSWPQWFMFDEYSQIRSDESHGDVIVWPLKVVSDYLKQTSDFSILDEVIGYVDSVTFEKTKSEETLMAHIRKQIAYIEANFLPGTFLSCYGDGDWDDTLQPFDASLKKNMASSWTVALTYQTLRNFAEVIQTVDVAYAEHLSELVINIQKDYQKYMLATDVIPGFVYMEDQDHVEYMIHPTDTRTGIQYRLLPLTRTVIAELVDPKRAKLNYDIIQENLKFPDGVHLMNKPARYEGGVSKYFKRAEQAANFGREIGLNYIHAHIRYVEAVAKLGYRDETWQALSIINPISMRKFVKNAEMRQRNAYFSSSDGNFKNRYEARDNFDLLKTGDATVKGGWRVYSSGPGIYVNQLVANVLGIRLKEKSIVFDPTLPIKLNQLKLSYKLLEQSVTIIYHVDGSEKCVKIDGEVVGSVNEANRYRQGGLEVSTDVLKEKLRENSVIEIYS